MLTPESLCRVRLAGTVTPRRPGPRCACRSVLLMPTSLTAAARPLSLTAAVAADPSSLRTPLSSQRAAGASGRPAGGRPSADLRLLKEIKLQEELERTNPDPYTKWHGGWLCAPCKSDSVSEPPGKWSSAPPACPRPPIRVSGSHGPFTLGIRHSPTWRGELRLERSSHKQITFFELYHTYPPSPKLAREAKRYTRYIPLLELYPVYTWYKPRQARISNGCRFQMLNWHYYGTPRAGPGLGPGGASHGTRALSLGCPRRPWNSNASHGCPASRSESR